MCISLDIFGCQTQKTNHNKRFFSRSSINQIYRRGKQKLKKSLKITVVHPKSNGEFCWNVSCSASIRVRMMEQTKVRNKHVYLKVDNTHKNPSNIFARARSV